MAEATATTAKPKSKPAAPQFETPFANIASEAPAAFRDMAEKSLSQAKDSYEKIKTAAEQATGVIEALGLGMELKAGDVAARHRQREPPARGLARGAAPALRHQERGQPLPRRLPAQQQHLLLRGHQFVRRDLQQPLMLALLPLDPRAVVGGRKPGVDRGA